MKNFLTLILCVNVFFTVTAQNIKIKGKVLDENSEAVIAATVALISNDSALIANTITNNYGDFELTTPKNSNFCFLRITHLEFENNYNPLIPDKDTTITVNLIERSILLNEVQIVAKKPIYEFKNEKLIVNINEIPNIQTYTISKLLQLLPGVIYTDGMLTLNGQAATVFLDGKKQTLNSSNINTIMSLMPVAAIEKIELIYSSGGVYDASDGAIINVVYKKQKVDGYYISVGGNSAAYGKSHFDGGSAATIIFKKKNVMLNSTLSYRNTYFTLQSNDTLQYWNNTLLYQDRSNESRINVYMGLLNLNWDIKTGHNLNFNFNFYDDFSNNTSKEQYIFQNDNINRNVWNVKSKGNGDMWAGQIEYNSPDSLKNKLKASYGIIYGGVRNHRNTFEEGSEILYTNTEMIAHRHTIKLDYEHDFSKKMDLQFGIKTDLGQLYDDVIYTESVHSNRYPTNHFFGKENIYAAYAKFNYTINESWSADASLRSEHTYYFLDFLSLNEKITNSYTNLFPFISTSYNSKYKNYQSSLSFGSSIARPDYNNMLPGVRYSNQFTYSKGNPELKPRISHTLTWRNLFYQFINTYLVYESDTNFFGTLIKSNAIDPLITEYNYQNLSDFNRMYFWGNISYQILSDKLSGQIGGYIQRFNYKHPRNGFVLPQGKNGYWRKSLNATCNYQITSQLGFNSQYFFYPEYDNLVYIDHTKWQMNAEINYNSPKNNWSLSLSMNDIFHTNKFFHEIHFNNNYKQEHSSFSSQYILLSFVLKFKGGEKVDDKAKTGSLETDRFSKN